MQLTPDYLAGLRDALRYAARDALSHANQMARGDIPREPGTIALTKHAERMTLEANRNCIAGDDDTKAAGNLLRPKNASIFIFLSILAWLDVIGCWTVAGWIL